MAMCRAQAETTSMQSVLQSTASTLKTTSGSHDGLIERVTMSSTEIRPTEGALSSRWGRDSIPRCLWDTAIRTFTRQLGKMGAEQKEVRFGAL